MLIQLKQQKLAFYLFRLKNKIYCTWPIPSNIGRKSQESTPEQKASMKSITKWDQPSEIIRQKPFYFIG